MITEQAPYPIEVQRKRIKGYRHPDNTKSVARPGPWGNPHVAGKDDCPDNQTAVIRFESDLLGRILKDGKGVPIVDRLSELRGKNLSCFCPIGGPCHRSVLLKYANMN